MAISIVNSGASASVQVEQTKSNKTGFLSCIMNIFKRKAQEENIPKAFKAFHSETESEESNGSVELGPQEKPEPVKAYESDANGDLSDVSADEQGSSVEFSEEEILFKGDSSL
jgi:hypothetical protein